MISDSTGMAVEGSTILYAPFGEIRSGVQSGLTDFGYTGQRLDSASGRLMYYGARYYLPGLRRFVSADTVVPSAVNGQALNRYSYVYNNPMKYTDPTGHRACIDGVICGGRNIGEQVKSYLVREYEETLEEEYNVSINFNGTNPDRNEQYSVIQTIYDAVTSMGEQIADAINDQMEFNLYNGTSILPSYISAGQAFRERMHDGVTFNIGSGFTVACGDVTNAMGCNHGNGIISLGIEAILLGSSVRVLEQYADSPTGNSDGYGWSSFTGDQLVIHEISHFVGDGYFLPEGRDIVDSAIYAQQEFGSILGAYTYQQHNYGSTAWVEFSTDAVATWFLNTNPVEAINDYTLGVLGIGN